jgi:hypothetical protein
MPSATSWNFDMPQQHATLSNPFQMTPIASGLEQPNNGMDPFAGLSNPSQGADDLFNFDVDVRFDLDGFWEDFTLGEGSGFPFR